MGGDSSRGGLGRVGERVGERRVVWCGVGLMIMDLGLELVAG